LRQHGLLLYLGPKEVIALAKLQANKELGRSFAGKLALTEGFHQHGVLSDEDYEEAKTRYTVSLIQKNKKPPTLKQIQKKQELTELENYYSRALDQWVIMKPKSKEYYLAKAKNDAKKVKAARLLLDLANPKILEAPQ